MATFNSWFGTCMLICGLFLPAWGERSGENARMRPAARRALGLPERGSPSRSPYRSTRSLRCSRILDKSQATTRLVVRGCSSVSRGFDSHPRELLLTTESFEGRTKLSAWMSRNRRGRPESFLQSLRTHSFDKMRDQNRSTYGDDRSK